MSFDQNEFDTAAEYYDLFERKSTTLYARMVERLDRLFQQHGVRRVLDMSCGTGAQAIPLARRGYEVTACDISERLLETARTRAGKSAIRIQHGDMRTSHFGSFDAVISMFNSVGYLSREDFATTVKNVARSLERGGLFVFDTTNRWVKSHFPCQISAWSSA
jgi:2-polyprenyl-3-methyl-5-hydroxy-6-metoxy-1,4-benzoquinol methylase